MFLKFSFIQNVNIRNFQWKQQSKQCVFAQRPGQQQKV